MSLIRTASGVVIRCFRCFEGVADYITGAAGPVFIGLAWVLTSVGGFVFFDVVASALSWPTTLLLLPIYILVPLNMYGQYYLVTHISPGFPVPRSQKDTRLFYPARGSFFTPERWGWERKGPMPIPAGPHLGMRVRRCRKCEGPKPERTHHCSVCNRCVLQMDHHCPWINACVGLHNQRHFVLFMVWLSFACWIVAVLGYPHFWTSVDMRHAWPAYTPRIAFTLIWVLSIAIGFAVPVLGGWHLYMVAKGETSIESHDNEYLARKAKEEGLIYLNPYDQGKRRNLEFFFNIGPEGYPPITLLFPLLVPPSTNGWVWPHRTFPSPAPRVGSLHAPEFATGLIDRNDRESGQGDGPGGRYVMGGGDELTDDEGGGGGWWEPE
ncbi:hypothetical protein CspHIS471_0703050 [Cutaneotrichosporon sp. HIS471]|nr:hypothetical protein CspHIS471_0703050 [Cutaneotrichosporon sp. HIS471]